MDSESQHLLAQLIRTQRVASLGTLRDGAPFVSLVLFAPAVDFSAFYVHISTLARHTRDIQADPRVSLMIAQTDDRAVDPQTLARISIEGLAARVPAGDPDYGIARTRYLARAPQAAFNFSLADFGLYAITPARARFVAGFGKIFNLSVERLVETSGLGP